MEEEESIVHHQEGSDSAPEDSFSYVNVWKDKLINSSAFCFPRGHENPTSLPMISVVQTSQIVQVGQYYLSSALKNSFTNFLSFSGDEQPPNPAMRLHAGMYYNSKDLFRPKVGDVRVQFYYAGHTGELVSVIAQQVGSVLHPFILSTNRTLFMVRSGKASLDDMFDAEHEHSRFFAWAMRFGGWLLLFIGMTFISHIIHLIASQFRFLRKAACHGAGSVTLTLSVSVSLVVIGGVWIICRPWLTFVALTLATLPFAKAAASSVSHR